MPATVTTVLAAIVARDLADDLVRAVTFGGGYRPTVGVMVQRHWGEIREKIAPVAARIRPDFYMEGHYASFRDNRHPIALDHDLRGLAGLLKAQGFTVKVSTRDRLARELWIAPSKDDVRLVEAAAQLYIKRIDRVLANAEVSL